MDEIKIKNFATSNPGTPLPEIRHLEREECESLHVALVSKLGLSVGSDALSTLRALESRASDVPNVRPSEDTFVLSDLFKRLDLVAESVFINWSRFEDIDEMDVREFSAIFHDLWYPVSDDIEIFDQGQSWVLLIRHYDVVQLVSI